MKKDMKSKAAKNIKTKTVKTVKSVKPQVTKATKVVENVKPQEVKAPEQVKEVDVRVKQATHIPMLVRIFEMSKGDVLELGTGYFSTALLRWLCQMAGRVLYSFESSEFWYAKVTKEVSPYHKIFKVIDGNWDKADIDRHWGMALVDHAPNQRRWADIERLANKAEYIVIHDSNLSEAKQYGYEKIWKLFKYRYDYKKLNPNTTVVSNFHDLSSLEK